ncbi:MAG: HNH endonuclease signature motif containing protein, partial [Candidatus Eisenbacteria bacterium]|nr:HNH endonuclease signature motif containing protein [Candidatus Eisenbacteria bacterium]
CEAARQIAAMERMGRGLHILRCRILATLQSFCVLEMLGYPDMGAFAEARLDICAKTMDALLDDAELFGDHPLLARAFLRGWVSREIAYSVHAQSNTEREMRWLLERMSVLTAREARIELRQNARVAMADHAIATRNKKPGAKRDLVEDLEVEILSIAGWTEERLRRELRARGSEEIVEGASWDPAENPSVRKRIDLLTEILLEQSPIPGNEPPDLLPKSVGKMFALPRGWERRRLWLPDPTARDLAAAFREVRRRMDAPWLEPWEILLLMIDACLKQWRLEDPERPAAKARILERDIWHCQAPGCGGREHLESHHMHARARGGRNTLANQTALCWLHHRRGVHEGWIRAYGRAPQQIVWELGVRPGGKPPMLRLLGHRIVERFGEPVVPPVWES